MIYVILGGLILWGSFIGLFWGLCLAEAKGDRCYEESRNR